MICDSTGVKAMAYRMRKGLGNFASEQGQDAKTWSGSVIDLNSISINHPEKEQNP